MIWDIYTTFIIKTPPPGTPMGQTQEPKAGHDPDDPDDPDDPNFKPYPSEISLSVLCWGGL